MQKVVLLLFATSVIFVDPFQIHQIEDGKAHVRSCMFKIGISPMEANRLRKGDFSESNEKSHVSCRIKIKSALSLKVFMQCFMKCVFEKSGFMHNGTLVESAIMEKLRTEDQAEDEVKEMFDLCKDVEHENSCELAFKVYKCYWANIKS